MASEPPMTANQPDVAAIAKGLGEHEREFLDAVLNKRSLGLADRAADRVRQSMRRAGLVRVAKNPRRWVATDAGKSVAAYLSSSTVQERKG